MKTSILIKKLLKKDTKENIKLFSDIKIQKEYSNLSKEISIQFHNNTYSSFYKNLKNFEQVLKKGNTFSPISTSPYPTEDPSRKKKFDFEKMKNAIRLMKEEEKNMQKKKKNPYTERNRDSLSFSIYGLMKNKKKIIEQIKKKREKEKKIVSPDLGRYNPKYKSIEKHTQRVIFSFKNFKKFNTAYNQKLMIKKRKLKEEDNIIKAKIENMKKKLKKINFNFKKNAKKNLSKKEKNNKSTSKTEQNDNNVKDIPNLFQNTAIYKKSRNANNSELTKDNHCFKFETYTSRKPLLVQTTYEGDSIYKLSSSVRSIKESMNKFYNKKKKLTSRNYLEDFIKNKNSVPSIGFYRPNYSFVTNKTMDIYFNGKKDQKSNIKYFKLKKILGNYNVREEYELFRFLNSDKDNNKNLY